MRLRARHYATSQPVDLLCEEGRIRALAPPSAGAADLEAGWVAPAWFDLQINGCEGRSFNSGNLTTDAIYHVVAACRRHGIGAFCPTLVTNSLDALLHAFSTLRRACESDPALARALPGYHLEGPYISPEDGPRGAHPRCHVRPPDWDEFRRLQEAAAGCIRLVTLAPEYDGALRFIEALTASGVIVALGHTAAPAARLHDAVAAGARLSTHLGNGSHALLPRHENYLWEQLADDNLWASVICDGHHLPPAVVRCFLRVKTAARTILTCDAGTLAGLPPGCYREWDQEFEVLASGKIVVAGTSYLGGSWAFTDVCVGNVLRFADVTLRDAVEMASTRPRTLLGLPVPCLEPGEPADLVLFDWEKDGALQVRATVIEGTVVLPPPRSVP